eukprot:TRINITY_DN699_c0_g1_i4.p1 TRINITY_DN699_c0_g1~~TRINITY_DN699_c0_g1_i4.p1  ORF type:complete len:541 (-),score=96.87 TRINITY_DN699_c0_g1_i4:30-1652(-)
MSNTNHGLSALIQEDHSEGMDHQSLSSHFASSPSVMGYGNNAGIYYGKMTYPLPLPSPIDMSHDPRNQLGAGIGTPIIANAHDPRTSSLTVSLTGMPLTALSPEYDSRNVLAVGGDFDMDSYMLYNQSVIEDVIMAEDDAMDDDNMDKLYEVLVEHDLPLSYIEYDGLSSWITRGENRDSNDSEDGDLTSRSGEIDLKDYQLPPYRYICGGCGAFYLKSQSVAAHNRACEKYLEQKADNNGVLKNKKEKVSKKWWLNYLINNSDQRDGFRKTKKSKKGPRPVKKSLQKKSNEYDQQMEYVSNSYNTTPSYQSQDIMYRKDMYNTLSMSLDHWLAIYHEVLIRSSINIVNQEGYSETPPILVNHVISQLRLNREDVLLDIGSGIGNVLIQVSAQVGCRSFGIEIREDLHHIANHMKENYITIMKENRLPFGDIQLLHGNVLSDEIEMFLSKVNTVMVNNIHFKKDMEDVLLHKFSQHLKHGARVVTCRELFNEFKIPPDSSRSSSLSMFDQPTVGTLELDTGSIYYYIYVVNRFRNFSMNE